MNRPSDQVKPDQPKPVPVNICTNYASMTTSPTRGPAKICMSYSLGSVQSPSGHTVQPAPGGAQPPVQARRPGEASPTSAGEARGLVKPRQPEPVRLGDPVKPEHSESVPVNICTNYTSMTTSPTPVPAKICTSYRYVVMCSLRLVEPSHQFKPGDLVKHRQPVPVKLGGLVKPEHSESVPVNICTNYASMTTSPTRGPAKICTSYRYVVMACIFCLLQGVAMESLGKKFQALSISRRVQPEEPTYLLDLSIQTVSGPGLVAVCCSNLSIRLHSSADGTVKTWDVRCPGSEATQVFRSDASHLFCSFDVSCNDVVLCAGTEQLDEDDSFLVFWDARMNKDKNDGVLGVYSESHSDDITQVRFHPRNADRLVSGSTDGLVNVFDLSLGAEEEALQATCNCGSSASSVCWAGKDLNQLLCLTHDEGLHLWDLGQLDTDKPITLFSAVDARNQTAFPNQGGLDYFVGGTWLEETGHLLVLGGTNRGDIHLLECSEKGLCLLSSPQQGHSAVVRCFIWDSAGEALLTGGEDAQLLLWKPGAEELNSGKKDALKSGSALHFKSRLHKKHGFKKNKKKKLEV
ncbi:hypothetical protein DPEC_G00292310 [Dallia pectoralis]|uniref:Uncharacterized protein n=1 Tax=Dallia pectoralis TaxID=75939 RepID=A0ACC2FI40_DALPE|nr:hypothetical protein DPEC_G00292310 [Dallia pectoralis]